MMICGIENRTFPDQQDIEKYVLAFQKKISIKTNLKNDIIKHEYIGNDTFIILADFLYFGLVDHATDTMTLSKQIFPGKVISFSANQDHDKKTEQGRTRFIPVLVNQGDLENPAEQKQKVLIVDMWSFRPTVQVIPLQEKDRFDRISFFKDIISLWSNDELTSRVKEIKLNPNWILSCNLKLCLIKTDVTTIPLVKQPYLIRIKNYLLNIFMHVKNFLMRLCFFRKS